MRRVSGWGVGSNLVVVIALLIGASVAVAAVTGPFKGKTAQQGSVSFTVSGGAVRNFDVTVLDKCPDGHNLAVHASGYPPMAISKKRRFGGVFTPVGAHSGEGSSIKGRVSGRKVTGTVTNVAYSTREGALCRGKTHFTAHHA